MEAMSETPRGSAAFPGAVGTTPGAAPALPEVEYGFLRGTIETPESQIFSVGGPTSVPARKRSKAIRKGPPATKSMLGRDRTGQLPCVDEEAVLADEAADGQRAEAWQPKWLSFDSEDTVPSYPAVPDSPIESQAATPAESTPRAATAAGSTPTTLVPPIWPERAGTAHACFTQVLDERVEEFRAHLHADFRRCCVCDSSCPNRAGGCEAATLQQREWPSQQVRGTGLSQSATRAKPVTLASLVTRDTSSAACVRYANTGFPPRLTTFSIPSIPRSGSGISRKMREPNFNFELDDMFVMHESALDSTFRNSPPRRVTCTAGPGSPRGSGMMRSSFDGSGQHASEAPHRCVWHPDSTFRLIFSVLGPIFIAYDLVWLPIWLSQIARPSMWTFSVQTMMMMYWATEIGLSFRTGFYENAVLEMQPHKISRRYITSWFFWDFSVVVIDLVVMCSMLLETEKGGTGIAGSLRILHLFRLGRLLRLLRLWEIVQKTLDKVAGATTLTMLQAFNLLLGILTVIHFISCAWYACGASTDKGWVSVSIPGEAEDGGDAFVRWVHAYHWTLTQFTPATNNITPRTTAERGFAVLVVVFALVVFSTFQAKMTSSLTQLLSIGQTAYREELQLRRFFGAYDLSAGMRQSLWMEFRRLSQSSQIADTHSINVPYLVHMPIDLKAKLSCEMYWPTLRTLPVMCQAVGVSRDTVTAVCHGACSTHSTLDVVEIFSNGMEAQSCYCLTRGGATYLPVLQNTSRMKDAQCGEEVLTGTWFSEPALFGRWVHRGRLRMLGGAHWVEVSAAEFRIAVEDDSDALVLRLLSEYAGLLADELQHDMSATDTPTEDEKEVRMGAAATARRMYMSEVQGDESWGLRKVLTNMVARVSTLPHSAANE